MNFIDLKKDKYLLLLLTLGHLVWFIAAVFIWKRPYSYDSVEYMQMAENFKRGLYYSGNAQLPVTEHFITLRPPVYSVLILLCWTLFGYNAWAILLVQNIISIITCLMVRNTFQKLFPHLKNQFFYWLLILMYPMQMVFANMIFCDILFQFFLMLYLHQLLLFTQDGKRNRFWHMGLWLLAGVFTKPILYPFLFLHLAFTLICSLRFKKKFIILSAIIPVLLVLLYGAWNEKRTGVFHISSVQSYNLLEYNVAEFYRYKYGNEAAGRKMEVIKKQVDQAKTFKEQYNLSATIARQKIKEDIVAYSVFHSLKSLQLFFDPNKLEFDIFSRRFHYVNNYQESFATKLHSGGLKGAWAYLQGYPFLLLLIITPFFGLFRFAGLLLFLFNKRNNTALRIAIAVFVFYFAFITGPVANARYFLPVLMVTSACSWVSYAGLWQKWKLKSVKRNDAIQ